MTLELSSFHVGDVSLNFAEKRADDTVVAVLTIHSTREIREQVVDPHRFVKNRSTVLRRMRLWEPDEMTPQALLHR
jgi:hypothetical protein